MMIAIPLPFVVALLLSILAVLLFIRRTENSQPAFVFIALCALMTSVVGLRWTFDYALFRLIQPIVASFIPVTAWYCFSSAHKHHKFRIWHVLPPIFVILSSFTYPFWRPPLDPFLTLLYVVYGIALIYASRKTSSIPEQVRLSEIDQALHAERIAGAMLLMSAMIDSSLAVDFSFFEGDHALIILTLGHAILLPVLSIAVIMVSHSVVPRISDSAPQNQHKNEQEALKEKPNQQLSTQDITNITQKVDALLTTTEVYLDPDLTLDRLARKAGIPARQISSAINQVYGRNISQVVNEYRIERAKLLLMSTDKSVTQIYLDSGFQTKSNFNREFTRITGQTPSAYRRTHLANKESTPEIS